MIYRRVSYGLMMLIALFLCKCVGFLGINGFLAWILECIGGFYRSVIPGFVWSFILAFYSKASLRWCSRGIVWPLKIWGFQDLYWEGTQNLSFCGLLSWRSLDVFFLEILIQWSVGKIMENPSSQGGLAWNDRLVGSWSWGGNRRSTFQWMYQIQAGVLWRKTWLSGRHVQYHYTLHNSTLFYCFLWILSKEFPLFW